MFCLGVSGNTIVEAPCCPPIGAVTFTGNDSTCTVTVRWFRSDGTPISDAYSVQVALGAGQNYVIRGNIYPNNKLFAGQAYYLRITAQGTTVDVRYVPQSDMEIYNFRVSMWMQATDNEDGTYSVIIELGSESCWSTFGYLSEVASVTSSASETVRFSVQIARQVSSALSLADAVRRMLRRRRVSSVGAIDAVRRALRRRRWSFASLLDTVITRALVSVRLSHSITSAIKDYYVFRSQLLASLFTAGIIDYYRFGVFTSVASAVSLSDRTARALSRAIRSQSAPSDFLRKVLFRRGAEQLALADAVRMLRSVRLSFLIAASVTDMYLASYLRAVSHIITVAVSDFYKALIHVAVRSAVHSLDAAVRRLVVIVRSQSVQADLVRRSMVRRLTELQAPHDAAKVIASVRLSYGITSAVADFYLLRTTRVLSYSVAASVLDYYRLWLRVAVRSFAQVLDRTERSIARTVRSASALPDIVRRAVLRRAVSAQTMTDYVKYSHSVKLAFTFTSSVSDYYVMLHSITTVYAFISSVADYYRLWFSIAVRSAAPVADVVLRRALRTVRESQAAADVARRGLFRRAASMTALADYVKYLRSVRVSHFFAAAVADIYFIQGIVGMVYEFRAGIVESYRIRTSFVQSVRIAAAVSDAYRFATAWRLTHRIAAAVSDTYRLTYTSYVVHAFATGIADYYRALVSARLAHVLAFAVSDYYVVRVFAPALIAVGITASIADYYMLKLPVMTAWLFRAGVSDYYRFTAPAIIMIAVHVQVSDAYQLFEAVARVFGIAWLFTTGLERCRQLVARANP